MQSCSRRVGHPLIPGSPAKQILNGCNQRYTHDPYEHSSVLTRYSGDQLGGLSPLSGRIFPPSIAIPVNARSLALMTSCISDFRNPYRISLARPRRLALVRIELLLNHRLRPCLLPRRLMLGLKLHLAALADSDDRNILDSFHDAEIALGHEHSLPQFCPAAAYFVSRLANPLDAEPPNSGRPQR
jgi:hypothetical protein